MSSIKISIVANLIGKIAIAGMSILLVPQYVKYLGIESYGLIGFFGTLAGSLVILDFGLGTTLSRELAKFKERDENPESIRNLTFSLELIYWGIGILTSIAIIFLAEPIAEHWINAERLPIHTIKVAVMLMGLIIAFQWPIGLYNGGLTGLEKQIWNNGISVAMTALRAIGVIFVMKYFSATILAFFSWQALITALHVLIMRWALWRQMPAHSLAPKFSSVQVKTIWRFAAGMTGISLATFFLSQIDKITLSKLLPLSQFGYYTLAFTVASAINLVVTPVSTAFFPRFASLVNVDEGELTRLYHKACTLIASLIFPVCLILLFFTYDILRIWTNNTTTTDNAYLLARILLIGSMLNALMVMPYYLIVASGWVRFTLYQNIIASIILVPMLFVWTNLYGAVGATFVWLVLNAGYIIISQPLMHRKLLRKELFNWYWKDTLMPLLPSLAVIVSCKIILTYLLPQTKVSIVIIGSVTALALTASLFRYKNYLSFVKQLISAR